MPHHQDPTSSLEASQTPQAFELLSVEEDVTLCKPREMGPPGALLVDMLSSRFRYGLTHVSSSLSLGRTHGLRGSSLGLRSLKLFKIPPNFLGLALAWDLSSLDLSSSIPVQCVDDFFYCSALPFPIPIGCFSTLQLSWFTPSKAQLCSPTVG